MFKYLLVAVLLVISQQALALTCKSLVEKQISNQLDTSTLFNNREAMFVVIICALKPLPVYFMLHTKLMSEEQLKTNTPVTTFVNLKLPVNPNGKTKASGFLAVNRAETNSFTLRLRTRLATGEAIDVGKKVVLLAGQSIVFEESVLQIGVVRLGQ